jgi:hypothetical protein
VKDASVVLVDACGGTATATLDRGSLVLPGIIILALRDEATGARRHLALAGDGLVADEARRLRARLRVAA